MDTLSIYSNPAYQTSSIWEKSSANKANSLSSPAHSSQQLQTPTSINNQNNRGVGSISSNADKVQLTGSNKSQKSPQSLPQENLFSSYIDILNKQKIASALLNVDKNGATTQSSNNNGSLLGQYQTMQLQQNPVDKVFNNKADIFKQTLSTYA